MSFFFQLTLKYDVWAITIESSNVVFFWLNSPTTSLALTQWIVSFFFQNNQLVRQFRLVSKEMLRSQQLVSLSCCFQLQRSGSSFFSRRFGAASNITREVDDYGKEKKVFFPVDSIFRLSSFFFCWFIQRTVSSSFVLFFVKQNCCVDTNSIEREEKKTMQMRKVG